ncbi:type I glyceraldehyde-3-phosphate dehydrogenase [Desulfolutivibrio sulfoxidireducens]|uniref:type I glyceraldehyde-3-phosphate dehydrogenase n=1 Tax=Desulfolutivibrio sulfoxidireducens TaxID=2773299 RepID=UPI00159DD6FA|nr:type I glyceraldehyde-3-phosphate dehydrogenase [Desulfolutivibrio sulfoxidireducens]QLA17603.1 type I glyceraldehyde-3-phosphate dehydrogenase [Desulfolutivibrio sulfoxidireducens]QLA21178.1 type I glyceraldehyde-3-phosphate dehydrogenase [Desulfolutivibrio sulfoxidireducens]
MSIRIGINGFGRIGRYLIRLLNRDTDVEVVAVNARADNPQMAHLLKYDSVHGHFPGVVETTPDGLSIDGKPIRITRHGAGEWQWGELGCDLVVESTGKFNDRESCEKHLARGAKTVVISAPAKGEDITVVMGVNQHQLKPEHKIISNASCTTNCLAPVVKVLHETFGMKHGIMTTIHSYTMSQRVLDGSHKDWRRGRACAVSMIPTTTGAARAVTKVMPELAGKLDGMSIRVPTPNVSVVDLTAELEKPTDTAGLLAVLKAAANEHMGYTDEPLVSVDFMGDTHGGVVDAGASQVLDGTLAKVLVWYDNEAGFTNQLLRLIKLAGSMM